MSKDSERHREKVKGRQSKSTADESSCNRDIKEINTIQGGHHYLGRW